MVRQSEVDVANFFYCSSILEEKVFLLYKRLSENVQNLSVKSLLLYIAYDSLRRSIILRRISSSIAEVETKSRDCSKSLGDIWKIVTAFSEESSRRKIVDCREFSLLVDRLKDLENSHYLFILVQFKTLQYIDREICKMCSDGLGQLKSTFELMISDEETHKEIIETIKNLLLEEQERRMRAPLVKYQNPDAWYKTPA
jgi:hypothetical protein